MIMPSNGVSAKVTEGHRAARHEDLSLPRRLCGWGASLAPASERTPPCTFGSVEIAVHLELFTLVGVRSGQPIQSNHVHLGMRTPAGKTHGSGLLLFCPGEERPRRIRRRTHRRLQIARQ